MCMAIAGPKGEGGLDDATGAGGTGASSMKQTSGTINLGSCWCMLQSSLEGPRMHSDILKQDEGAEIWCLLDAGDVQRGEEGDSFGMGFRFPWQKKKEEKKKK